jgi:hypothetical protein
MEVLAMVLGVAGGTVLYWVGAGRAWTPTRYWQGAGMVLLLGAVAGLRKVQLGAVQRVRILLGYVCRWIPAAHADDWIQLA